MEDGILHNKLCVFLMHLLEHVSGLCSIYIDPYDASLLHFVTRTIHVDLLI